MDFIKKNIGLLIFLVVCIGVIIYEAIAILGAQEIYDKAREEREGYLKAIQEVKRANKRLDDANQEKADENVAKAKKKYEDFANRLAAKRILPGIDFTADRFEIPLPPEPKEDEDGKVIPVVTDYERYKDNPNRKRFDKWMEGSLQDARDSLRNEIERFSAVSFLTGDEKAVDTNMEDGMGREDADESQKTDSQSISNPEEASDPNESKWRKIARAATVSPYFMFGEYCQLREQGFKNSAEQRDVFRQLILFELVIGYLRQAEIECLNNIEFPTELEIIDGDKYKYIPIRLEVTGKPECIETLINLFNANEKYNFYLRNIAAFDASFHLNTDSRLAFNHGEGTEGSSAKTLDGLLRSAGKANADGVQTSTRSEQQPRESRRSRRRNATTEVSEGSESRENKEELALTRKQYRVFVPVTEEKSTSADGMPEAGTETASLDVTTAVRVTLLLEYAEFSPITE